MDCPHVNAFFSCSFKEEDKEVNNFFKAVCEALNIISKNVSDGYSDSPPDVARKMIEESKIVLAVAPKRDKTSDNKWAMPSAVREEISMAYALKKPTLIAIETGVTADGFFNNYGTLITFERDKLYTNDFIKKTVASLHNLRMQTIEQNHLLFDQDAAGFYAEKVSFLIELVKENNSPQWRYNSTRKLVFTRLFEGQIKNSAWAEHVPIDAIETIGHSVSITSSKNETKHISQTIKDTPQQLVVGMSFEPCPQKDDWIEVDFSYFSPHLNVLEKSQISEDKKFIINGKSYECFDGMIPIQPTREMHVQLRFPAWYPIEKDSFYPFVGSYSSGIDYIVESEIKRCKIENSKFGSSTIIDIRVESPLPRHLYGVAWNLK